MRTTLIGVISVLALVLLGCQKEDLLSDGILVVGLESNPTNLDPRLSADAASSRINDLVFSRLFRSFKHVLLHVLQLLLLLGPSLFFCLLFQIQQIIIWQLHLLLSYLCDLDGTWASVLERDASLQPYTALTSPCDRPLRLAISINIDLAEKVLDFLLMIADIPEIDTLRPWCAA